MTRQLKNPKLYLMLLADAALLLASLMGAYLIRFEFSVPDLYLQQARQVLILVIPIKLGVFLAFGLYRGMWRYTGLRDILRVLQASVVCLLVVTAILLYVQRFGLYSRAVFLLDGIFTFILTGGLRIAIRAGFAMRSQRTTFKEIWFPWTDRKTGRNVIIVGAGDAGEKILREIQDSPRANYHVACFLDDHPDKQGRTLHGVPINGPIDRLPEMVSDYSAEEVFIAMPSASGSQTRRIVELCEKTGIPFKTLPGLRDIMDGKVSIQALRNVDYEDLLGRPPVELEKGGIAGYLKDKTILVTGCGGSIGSELCRQIVPFSPVSLVLVDAGESNLYQIQMELHHLYLRSALTKELLTL
jgi:FlaA1/EpsC-like NDP-sugar epimerase